MQVFVTICALLLSCLLQCAKPLPSLVPLHSLFNFYFFIQIGLLLSSHCMRLPNSSRRLGRI